jgi:hypothetical protein
VVVEGKGNSTASEIAREVNAHILAFDAHLNDVTAHTLEADAEVIDFFCECGCMATVVLTRREYADNGGAWVEGHRPQSPHAARVSVPE